MRNPIPLTLRVSRRDLLRYAGLGGALAAASIPLGRAGRAAATTPTKAPDFFPLRPPATPLAVRSMYLSTWLAGDSLVGQWPTFWSGQITALTGIVRVDGAAYLFAGAPDSPSIPALSQVGLTVTGTQSNYLFSGAGIQLEVNFFSPVDSGDLRRQSVPMSYITTRATSMDGRAHQVGIYLDISGEWGHGDRSQLISWDHRTVGSQTVLSFSPTHPTVLSEYAEQAGWGTVVCATDAGTNVTWQIAQDTVARTNGTRGVLPNSSEAGPRAISDRWPVFAFSRDLGIVSPAARSAEMVLTIGHVRTPAVSYLGAPLDPWWRTYWAEWTDMLVWFRSDYEAALIQSTRLDQQIVTDAIRFFGADTPSARRYSGLCALALRQALAATELVSQDGTPWALLKEISSSGNVSTVDVIYPAAPAYLYLSPTYLRLLLEPPLTYAESGRWPQPFAEHDIGEHYPNASGHDDGGGENMPVEESANILILSAAALSRLDHAESARFVSQHYSGLRGWAEYLIGHALDPAYQNQTDDFTGFIAHSSNLALKGIIGIGAMGLIAEAAGNPDDHTRYLATARSYLRSWVTKSQDPSGRHLKLTYDLDGTWSLKYNGYADRLLGLKLVPDAVASEEAAWYAGQARSYGVALDSRHNYTKADWELWTAAFLADYPGSRDLLVDAVYQFAHTTPTRVPLTDWYDTNSGDRVGFAGRPVVGGFFSLLSLPGQTLV